MKYTDIIEQLQSDLNKGLTKLYEGYGKQLYGYGVQHMHLSEDESYDALYKTLYTVGQVIDRYEFNSESHFKNWLFKIHKNNVLQILRTRKNKEQEFKPVSFDEWIIEAEELEDSGLDLQKFKPAIEMISEVNRDKEEPSTSPLMPAMQEALKQISDVERELLFLRMKNYSYDEIADMLGIENKQLKVKFLRAKAKVEKITLEFIKEKKDEKN